MADEVVFLQLDEGVYYGLDAVGTRMLELMLDLPTFDAVTTQLELEFDAPLDSTCSVALGKFDVPVHLKTDGATGEDGVWIRLGFDLYAETSPEDEAALVAAVENHRGPLNDALLTVIRTCAPDELTDPRAAALKLRMTEVARPLLGERLVRQLVIPNLMTQQL